MNPIAIPCRVCLAGPGTVCRFENMPPQTGPGAISHHPTRESDAILAVEVLSDLGRKMAEESARLAASPAVIRRSVVGVADGSPGLVFHHEGNGGDGRYHVTNGKDDTCGCGARHHDRNGIPASVDAHGFSPPEAFCEAARAELARAMAGGSV